jgi:hypothetical protein
MQPDNKTMPIENRPGPLGADRDAERATNAAASTADAAIKDAYIADKVPPEREEEAGDQDEEISSAEDDALSGGGPGGAAGTEEAAAGGDELNVEELEEADDEDQVGGAEPRPLA